MLVGRADVSGTDHRQEKGQTAARAFGKEELKKMEKIHAHVMGRREIPNIAYKRQKYHSTADKCFLKSLGLYLPLYILKLPSNRQIIVMKARTTVRVMLKVPNEICKLWARANLKMLTLNGRMSFLTIKISGFDLKNRLPNYWINKIILGSSVAMIFFCYRFGTAHALERERLKPATVVFICKFVSAQS